jgi:hypothetical protein
MLIPWHVVSCSLKPRKQEQNDWFPTTVHTWSHMQLLGVLVLPLLWDRHFGGFPNHLCLLHTSRGVSTGSILYSCRHSYSASRYFPLMKMCKMVSNYFYYIYKGLLTHHTLQLSIYFLEIILSSSFLIQNVSLLHAICRNVSEHRSK